MCVQRASFMRWTELINSETPDGFVWNQIMDGMRQIQGIISLRNQAKRCLVMKGNTVSWRRSSLKCCEAFLSFSVRARTWETLLQTVHASASFCAICRDTSLCPMVHGTPGELHVPSYKHERRDLSSQLLSALPFNSVEAGSSRHLAGPI